MIESDLSEFPGGDLVSKGVADLEVGLISEEALLVLAAGPRLRGLGFKIAEPTNIARPYEHRLYELLEQRLPLGAHGAYNALIGRIVSFANAYSSNNPA